MRVLVACEYSGIVREAFASRSHDQASCDLLASEQPGQHYQQPVEEILNLGWDLMIAHPPCTHLAVSGSRWFKDKVQEQSDALAFVQMLMDAPIERIAIENPISVISTKIRPPDQYIHPWAFGHEETKKTCLWLKNLPPLIATAVMAKREAIVHNMSPGPDRWKNRSRTYTGIAAAMAEQWG